MIKNIEDHRKSAKWLKNTLAELVQTVSKDDATLEQQRLDTILQRYKDLLPAVELTTTRSSIVVQSYDYKEDLDRETQWLQVAAETAEEMANEAPALDDVTQVICIFYSIICLKIHMGDLHIHEVDEYARLIIECMLVTFAYFSSTFFILNTSILYIDEYGYSEKGLFGYVWR